MNNQNTSLKYHHTFATSCTAENFVVLENQQDLEFLIENFADEINQQAFYLLGEGSNTLFIDEHIKLVVKPAFTGIECFEHDDFYLIEAAAGENWHNLVELCLKKGMHGLENLALIPGSVGAAPVQNIGAYGVELASFCHEVFWFDFATQTTEILTKAQCQFSYRESIFKKALKNKGLITKVSFKLPKNWQPKTSYQGLAELPLPQKPQAIFDKVIELRNSKLPDPKQLPNAGSFFKNPVVSNTLFNRLKSEYANMPAYLQDNGDVKLAAGWLIEQAGLKGVKVGKVGVHKNQALVLVNYHQGSGKDIAALAKQVVNTVFDKFEITLEPEVRFIKATGECNAIEVLKHV